MDTRVKSRTRRVTFDQVVVVIKLGVDISKGQSRTGGPTTSSNIVSTLVDLNLRTLIILPLMTSTTVVIIIDHKFIKFYNGYSVRT